MEARQLPTMTKDNVTFYIDFRLKEIRPINSPFLAVWFVDLPESYKAEIRGIRAKETQYGHIPELDN